MGLPEVILRTIESSFLHNVHEVKIFLLYHAVQQKQVLIFF